MDFANQKSLLFVPLQSGGMEDNMKKTFKLEELDCAHCAAKMETAIAKIDGVVEAKISFMTQKLTIEADEMNFNSILAAAQKAIKKIEPDCRIIVK